MPAFSQRINRLAYCSFAAASFALIGASAADASPVVNFNFSVLGGPGGPFTDNFNQNGVATGWPGVYNYQHTGPGSPYPGGVNGPSSAWSINSWNFNADGDPTGTGQATGAKINAGFTITNNLPEFGDPTLNHLHFSIMITMSVMPSVGPTSFFGSGGMALTVAPNTFNNWGFLSAPTSPMWNFMVDGADVASLFGAGYQLGSSGPGTANASANLLAGQTTPLAGLHPTTMGIRIDFELTPGETVGFTGVFGFLVPAPAGLALLTLGGLSGRSRRRR